MSAKGRTQAMVVHYPHCRACFVDAFSWLTAQSIRSIINFVAPWGAR